MRVVLVRLVAVMALIVVCAFLFILLKGTLGSGLQTNASNSSDELVHNLALGETALRRDDAQLFWVSRLTTEQTNELSLFSDSIVQLDSGCLLESQICILSSQTERSGVQLRFVEQAPIQLPSDTPWTGGFVNPNDGAVYDLIGRPYRFQGEVRSLKVVNPTP